MPRKRCPTGFTMKKGECVKKIEFTYREANIVWDALTGREIQRNRAGDFETAEKYAKVKKKFFGW